MKNTTTRIALSLVFLSGLFVADVFGCTCSNTGTVKEALDSADNVVILTIESVAKSENPDEGNTAVLVVEKVYKGNLKKGDRLTFEDQRHSCSFSYRKEDIGRTGIHFLGAVPIYRNWGNAACSRVGSVQPNDLDYRYLENLEKVKGKSRISGSLSQWFGTAIEEVSRKHIPLAGHGVKILGNGVVKKVRTDEFGVFEVYGLPEGTYKVIPEAIFGFKQSIESARLNPETGDRIYGTAKIFEFELKKGGHEELDVSYRIENRVAGVFSDSQGQPMQGVCLRLLARIGTPHAYGNNGCTNADGKFEISSIPEGVYIIVINEKDSLSAKMPFEKFYYPGTTDINQASELMIGPAVFLDNINMSPPSSFRVVEITGRVVFADQQPIDGKEFDINVVFYSTSAANADEKKYGTTKVKADENGFFRLRILANDEGIVRVEKYLYQDSFKNCPSYDEYYSKQNTKYSYEMKTKEVLVNGQDSDVRLNLVIPFSSCKSK